MKSKEDFDRKDGHRADKDLSGGNTTIFPQEIHTASKVLITVPYNSNN